MSELTQLGVQFLAQGEEHVTAAVNRYTSSIERGERATDRLGDTQRRSRGATSQMLADIQRSTAAIEQLTREQLELARSTGVVAEAQSRANRRMREVANDNVRVAASMKQVTQAGVGLSRQFADIGVTAAMGMNPLMILVQQGPQLVDQMTLMKQQGIGMGAAFKSMGRDLLGVVRMMAPLAGAMSLVGGAAVIGFAAASTAVDVLNEKNKDLVAGMGLTEKQLQRLRDEGTVTAITLGDVFKGTWNFIAGAASDALEPLRRWIKELFKDITASAVNDITYLAVAWAKAYARIVTIWRGLPAAIDDATITAVNATIRAIEQMINAAIGGINKLIAMANSATSKLPFGLGKGLQMGSFGNVDLPELGNRQRGAAGRLGADVKAAEARAEKQVLNGIKEIAAGWEKAVVDVTKGRISDAAGKADRERAAAGRRGRRAGAGVGADGARDMSEERAAQLMQRIEQSKLDELQAQLQVVRDVQQRVAIQRQIIDAELAVRKSQTDREIASVRDEKGLTDAQKAAHIAALERVKASQENVAEIRKQAALQDGLRDSIKDAFELEKARRSATIDLLTAQKDAATDEKDKRRIDQELLTEKQALRRYELEQITKANGYLDQEVITAKAILETLTQREVAEQLSLKNARKDSQRMREAFTAVSGAFESVSDAFKEHDWGQAVMNLAQAIETFQQQLGEAGGKFGAIAGLVSGLGSMIGGTAGKAISGGARGAVGGFQIGNMLMPGIGGIVGAVGGGLFGFLGGIFGGNKQKRAERRAREQEAAEKAAEKAQEIAQEKRELELRLIEASGDKIAILAAQRDKELAEVNETNRELLRQVHAAEDAQRRYEKVRDLEIDALRASGDEIGALTKERAREVEAIDATLRPLQQMVYAAQDAGRAVDAAREALERAYDAELTKLQDDVSRAHDDLSAAYDRESGRLGDMISRLQDFGKTLQDFRRGLDADTTGLSPENAYNTARSQFIDVRNRALMGDRGAQDQYVGVAQAFKEASADFFGMGPGYFEDIEMIKLATDMAASTAERTASNAEQQLEQLKTLVSGYLDLNESTVSVRDAISHLETAEQALANTQRVVEPLLGINQGVMSLGQAIANYQQAVANQTQVIAQLAQAVAAAKADPANQPVPANDNLISQGYRSTNGDYAEYVRQQSDLLALFQRNSGMARDRTMEEFGLYHWANFGQHENRSVRPFAAGGRWMVGGSGSTDSQDFNVRASPWERVSIETPSQMGREAEAQESQAETLKQILERLEQLLAETKAEGPRYVERNRLLSDRFDRLEESFEIGKRRTG